MHQELDNPIWNSLNTSNAAMNLGNQEIAIFSPEVSPFVGMSSWDLISQNKLFEFLPKDRAVSTLVADPFVVSENWELIFSIGLYQMICQEPIPYSEKKSSILPLNDAHIPAMLELTALTKPGPFTSRTIEFGNYNGIFENQNLVAMAGERLHLNAYTEISAVCTHPEFLGKGYAAMLVGMLSDQIHKSGKTAFLHVRKDNERAIALYERLGFEIRTNIYFAVIKPKK